MSESWKETMVVLIPKIKEPRSVKDFRPISIVSTAYKIISKVLVNRWREVISEYVNIAQKGFIPGWDVSEASMIVQECWHTMERRMKNKDKTFIAKIDMEKAYDRVRWCVLEAALRATGYCDTWVTWLMACVKNAVFKFTMDGEMSEFIKVSNGLRQGDPLSPFLFATYGNVLSETLEKGAREGSFAGMEFKTNGEGQARTRGIHERRNRGIKITHQMFADDLIIFGRVRTGDLVWLKSVLSKFSEVTGQRINYTKSRVYTKLDYMSLSEASLLRDTLAMKWRKRA